MNSIVKELDILDKKERYIQCLLNELEKSNFRKTLMSMIDNADFYEEDANFKDYLIEALNYYSNMRINFSNALFEKYFNQENKVAKEKYKSVVKAFLKSDDGKYYFEKFILDYLDSLKFDEDDNNED